VDDDGFFTTPEQRLETSTAAITSDAIDLGDHGPSGRWWRERSPATVRITVQQAGDEALFVGIGHEDAVEAYLRGVPHDEITELDPEHNEVTYRREHRDGSEVPDAPGDEELWVARATGRGTQSLEWDVEAGTWAVVVMNEDASADVIADVTLAAKSDLLAPIAIGLGIGGVVLLIVATVLIVVGVASPHARESAAVADTTVAGADTAPAVSPVRIDAHLDPELSRWLWLVKWLLAIPHFVVLAFLWIAFGLLTFVAGIAILFTGRYPRSLFDFNVGVLRWTWRVMYYAANVLGTDRYPPFTLEATDYPADLDVAYPQQLSRGLVLVKWWLLALPHWLVLAVLLGGWRVGGERTSVGSDGGLITLLTFVAGVILLVTAKYPTSLFELLMGLNRWVYRVVAYVTLMTDVYPPFRLDQGGDEPSVVPSGREVVPPPPRSPVT
jgi:hypothetical protein